MVMNIMAVNDKHFERLSFEHYTIQQIIDFMDQNKMIINKDYQRGEVWNKEKQRELLTTIIEEYPIGVITIWNNGIKDEVLDGQQRIVTIKKFINESNVVDSKGRKFGDISTSSFLGYKIPCLRIKIQLDEDEVSRIFIRMQEGLPLNVGEKLHAFRSYFRETFVDAVTNGKYSFLRTKRKRYKDRFLTASFLTLELYADYDRKRFPELHYKDFKRINSEYQSKTIPKKIVKRYKKNLQFLETNVDSILKMLRPQKIIPIYMLVSYLEQKAVKRKKDGEIFQQFLLDFNHNLDLLAGKKNKPRDMDQSLYGELREYKSQILKGTTEDSLSKRFEIIKKQYERVRKICKKDPKRFADLRQKRRLFFSQDGKCVHCKKKLEPETMEADHIKKHEKGGMTEISNLRLLHHECHVKISQREQRTKSDNPKVKRKSDGK